MHNKICKTARDLFFTLSGSLILAGIVLLFVCPVSCRLTPQGIKILHGDYSSPQIVSYSSVGQENLRIVFSKDVKLQCLSLTPFIALENALLQSSVDEGGICIADMKLKECMVPGGKYCLYGEAVDNAGNSLTFSVPFVGYNYDVPDVEITEVHSLNGKFSSGGKVVLITEYVELTVLSKGNLAGLYISSAYDGEGKIFELPGVEVMPGDVIICHYRSNEEGCVSETGSDINLSSAGFSKQNVRDLWLDDNTAKLGDKMDVILLRNKFDDKIIDCVCYAPSNSVDWTKALMNDYVQEAFDQNKWPSVEIKDCVKSDNLTATKCLVKTGKKNSFSSWETGVCKENAASPD